MRIAILLISLTMCTSAASDGLIDSVKGFLNDPIGLKTSSNTLAAAADRSLLALKQLQDETDADISRYLVGIEEIIAAINSGAEDRINQALEAAIELEKKIYLDSVNLIWRAQCSAESVLTDTLKRSLADSINALSSANPQFKVFGIRVAEGKVEPVQVVDPDIAYRAVKREYLKRLESLQDTDDPYIILSTYINLSRLARLTQCHYIDSVGASVFISDYFEFERVARPWTTVVSVGI